MSEKLTQGNGADDRHEAATQMAEAAVRAAEAGDDDQASALLDQAGRTDPDAAADVLAERGAGRLEAEEDGFEPSSETVVPGSESPSRAGITGAGSGADNQGL